MSYESEMLKKFNMPRRNEVKQAILKSLFKHEGVIQEFSSDEEIVNEIANEFGLTEEQRESYLKTVYKKENRVKRSNLWHRLLYRAADSLAKDNFVSRPSKTIELTNKKEWMLTEKGLDRALELLKIPAKRKNFMLTKSFEVQKIAKELSEVVHNKNYNPINDQKVKNKIKTTSTLRSRGFRQAVIQAYDCKCSICGLKLYSPDQLSWEVEAAHIVPHSYDGKDDLLNGLALCRFHHWAFDVGWFTLSENFIPKISPKFNSIPSTFGKIDEYDLVSVFGKKEDPIFLPSNKNLYPHENSILWHRQNIFYK